MKNQWRAIGKDTCEFVLQEEEKNGQKSYTAILIIKGKAITLPWTLAWGAWVRSRFAAYTWPLVNAHLEKVYFDAQNNPCIKFSDILYDEKHIFPFGLDKEASWCATYQLTHKRWIIQHLGYTYEED